jgi:hypothetical protein
MKDEITLSFEDNTGLAEAFADKKVGDTVKLEVTAKIAALDEAGMTGSVLAIVPEGYEIDEENAGGGTESVPPATTAQVQPT